MSPIEWIILIGLGASLGKVLGEKLQESKLEKQKVRVRKDKK